MKGQIVKIMSDTHFVSQDGTVTPCKCRGKFRNAKLVPLVGDEVLFDPDQKVIEEVLPRKNAFIRPSVSNIDQAFLITSVKEPEFSPFLLDKLLVMMEIQQVQPIICVTKEDLLLKKEKQQFRKLFRYYRRLGYPVVLNTELRKIRKMFKNKTSVFTGQTGAGKSTLLNRLNPRLHLKTGEISQALGRGRHTTRTVELLEFCKGKVLDTPGFSSLEFLGYTKQQIKDGFPEFKKYPCPYPDCDHEKEQECNVKKAVEAHKILRSRYESYIKISNESRR